MARIKQLSKHMINQIAAGEVIERPASVVKELTENSVDAGSTRITIEISNDCRNIRIADNGCGIHPDDIDLAFSKHATSKIQKEEDLYDIHTLGFRGEALASIISISRLTCTTRTKDFESGMKVVCENSEVEYSKTGCAIGTIMDVKDLFYNIPARMKFLKSTNTEFSYIQEIVQTIALAHPEVSFELKKMGKTVLKTTGQGNLIQVIKEVYNNETVTNLKEVLKTDKISNMKISGYVSTPDFTKSSKKSYHLYINSRGVKCPVFQKAIDIVYRNLTAGNKYPFVVLNLEIPPTDVDVNVHPTKKEVRYKNANQIFNFIYSAIQAGLSNQAETGNSKIAQNTDFIKNSEVEVISFKQFNANDNITIDKKEDTIFFSDNFSNNNIENINSSFIPKSEFTPQNFANITQKAIFTEREISSPIEMKKK